MYVDGIAALAIGELGKQLLNGHGEHLTRALPGIAHEDLRRTASSLAGDVCGHYPGPMKRRGAEQKTKPPLRLIGRVASWTHPPGQAVGALFVITFPLPARVIDISSWRLPLFPIGADAGTRVGGHAKAGGVRTKGSMTEEVRIAEEVGLQRPFKIEIDESAISQQGPDAQGGGMIGAMMLDIADDDIGRTACRLDEDVSGAMPRSPEMDEHVGDGETFVEAPSSCDKPHELLQGFEKH